MRPRSFHWLLLAGLAALVAASCSRSATPAANIRPTATIKDIMDSMVDPSADVLWDSVATTVSIAGIEEKQPRTDEEWTQVRRNAIILIEATNLLAMEGRHVAKPGEKAENPDVELSPEAIEKILNQDRESWLKFLGGLHDAAMEAFKAIEARNVQGLLDSGEGIDTACENCHLKYWYPESDQAKAIQKAKEKKLK